MVQRAALETTRKSCANCNFAVKRRFFAYIGGNNKRSRVAGHRNNGVLEIGVLYRYYGFRRRLHRQRYNRHR